MNNIIITNLQLLLQQTDNSFKKRAINNVIKSINSINFKITSGQYARDNIDGIGKGIASRIDEILITGTLNELNGIDHNISEGNLHEVTGIGTTRIKKLNELKIFNVNELRKAIKENKVKITHHIEVGLKYFEDFKIKIPRSEIDKINLIIKKYVLQIDKNNLFTICGSYRRGKDICGDIDIVITNKNIENDDTNKKLNILKKIINVLIKEKYIVDNLTSNGYKKFMGVFKLNSNSISRRIDIRMVVYPEYYTGILYFTGSKDLNVKMRTEAKKQGYILNEYGLFKDGQQLIIKSENNVFDILNITYLEPYLR